MRQSRSKAGVSAATELKVAIICKALYYGSNGVRGIEPVTLLVKGRHKDYMGHAMVAC